MTKRPKLFGFGVSVVRNTENPIFTEIYFGVSVKNLFRSFTGTAGSTRNVRLPSLHSTEYFEKLGKRKKGASKRGRPRKGESADQPPAAAAKRLRKEFGFTQPQLQVGGMDQ